MYYVSLAIIWYLAHNTLVYADHAPTEAETMMEITWKLTFTGKSPHHHKY